MQEAPFVVTFADTDVSNGQHPIWRALDRCEVQLEDNVFQVFEGVLKVNPGNVSFLILELEEDASRTVRIPVDSVRKITVKPFHVKK